jgi:uncharacterized protein YyaL (SSP411 family)
VVIAGEGDEGAAAKLQEAAVAAFAFNKSAVRVVANQTVRENLPPALAETLPNLPSLGSGKSFAVLCSGSSCQPPVFDSSELASAMEAAIGKG